MLVKPRFLAAIDVLAALRGLKYGFMLPSGGMDFYLKGTIDVCNLQAG